MGRCLRCGYPLDAHCRADGSCMWARCEAFVAKWPDEPDKPPPAVAVALTDARKPVAAKPDANKE